MMERAVQLFIVSFFLILLTAGVTYRWTMNATDEKVKALQTKFTNLQQVVDSRNTQTQSELQSVRRDLEANTNAIRSAVGERFAKIEKKVEATQTTGEEQLNEALKGILSQMQDIQEQSSKVEKQISEVQANGGDFSGVIDQVMPGVLSIQSGNLIGSGFLISQDGMVVTNLHVVQNSADIRAQTPDRVTYRATLLASDSKADIALLRLNTPRNDFEYLKWGDSDKIPVGEPVATIGSPGGQKFSASKGVISSEEIKDSGVPLFQLDMAINPGNSGGPLFDRGGNVIGVAVGYKELEMFGLQRVGFAIKSNYVKDVVERLRDQVLSPLR